MMSLYVCWVVSSLSVGSRRRIFYFKLLKSRFKHFLCFFKYSFDATWSCTMWNTVGSFLENLLNSCDAEKIFSILVEWVIRTKSRCVIICRLIRSPTFPTVPALLLTMSANISLSGNYVV